jgi:hypothetical protein
VKEHSNGTIGPYGGTLRARVITPHGLCADQFYSLQKTSQPGRPCRHCQSRPPSSSGLMKLVRTFPDHALHDSFTNRVSSAIQCE